MIKKDFKQKYFLFCLEQKLEIKKYSEIFAQLNKKKYLCRIKITEL